MWAWLTSGLVLGWSIGANVAANVFATAVASGMIRFSTAVKLGALFVILGGLINGPAAMNTLGKLGAVDTFAAAFSVALASALAIILMTAAKLPVSAAQTAVGALVGYQLCRYGSISATAQNLLRTIIITWISVPFLAALTAFALYKTIAAVSRRAAMPLLMIDQWLRIALVTAGCYGAWALGGNNMANVVSFYVGLDLFAPLQVGPWLISQPRMLALFGGLAMAGGMATYSRRIMLTVGRDLVKLDAITAFIAILSGALVVDLLSHQWQFAAFVIPAIPVSISQALVGSILGLGLARGMQTIRLGVLRNILIGWITAPLISGGIAYVLVPVMLRFD
jgi:inorganic phosphate transporter, PiT family